MVQRAQQTHLEGTAGKVCQRDAQRLLPRRRGRHQAQAIRRQGVTQRLTGGAQRRQARQ